MLNTNTQWYTRAEKNVWSQFVELALVVQLNNCHTIPQVSQTTSYQKDLWRKKNTYHIFFFRGKKQESKPIPIWSLYHPQWIQWIIIALDNTGTLVVGSRLLAGQPVKDLGHWAVVLESRMIELLAQFAMQKRWDFTRQLGTFVIMTGLCLHHFRSDRPMI